MKYEKRIFLSLLWIVLGIVLILCGFAKVFDSDICIGMGGGWLICGILQLIRHIRYIKDKNYRENFDIETNDERNKYISSKAWSWAGYGFVLISGIASIVLLIANQRVFASVTSGSICLVITLYWISYLYLKRKY